MKRNFVDFLCCNKKSIGTVSAAPVDFLCSDFKRLLKNEADTREF